MKDRHSDINSGISYSKVVRELVYFLRENLGISQKEISYAIGITPSTISRAKIESGHLRHEKILQIIKRICEFYNVKIEFLDDKIAFNIEIEEKPKVVPNTEKAKKKISKREIAILISENKINDAIQKLKNFFIEIGNDDALDEIVLIMSNLAEFEKLERLGLIEVNSILLFKNRINTSILKICKFHLEE